MKLKFGMVGGGGGFIGNVHRQGAQLDVLAVLTAGSFSRNDEKNKETAALWGVEDSNRIYSSYQEMADTEAALPEDIRIDFVSIVTPNNTHYPIAKYFLEKGFHIVCDKPLALTSEQGEELEKLSREKGLLFGVTYTFTGYAIVKQAQEMVKSGMIGKIINIQAEYPQEWLLVGLNAAHSDQATWRMDPQVSGPSGCCADIGSHAESLIYKITGLRPKRVIAKFDTIPKTLKLETNVQILAEYGDGISGLIWTSQVALGHETELRVRIYGETGSLEWSHIKPWELRYTKINEPPQIYTTSRDYLFPSAQRLCRLPTGHIEGYYEAFGNIYREYCTALIAKKNGQDDQNDHRYDYPTVHDGIKGLYFVEACIESNGKNNTWVEVK
ncbi:MAG: Gfo/Idh/MocA family oxidoreductase [Clostridiales Family XIII bacterium]|nr:Gfo/Idh/MocA family oxidoreductase [Clostridiales Family XIII bacterium]